jgi:AcrR family transcriptional regulator
LTFPDPLTPAPPGRRARADRAILDATRALLAETGVGGLTVEGVAARSGVAKTTIYRRWRDRDELALAAVWHDLATGLQAPGDLGDTRAELLAFVEPLITVLRSPLMGGVIRGLASQIGAGGDLSRTYREQFIKPRIEQLEAIVGRGVDRGDLRPDTDVRLAHELLVGPAFYRLLFSGRPLDDELAGQITEAVLRAFAPPHAPSRSL